MPKAKKGKTDSRALTGKPDAVFVTCADKLRKTTYAKIDDVLQRLIGRGLLIVVSDASAGDEQVIRLLNGHKYKRVLVWGHSGHCEYMTVFGSNHPAPYMTKQRDQCAVARCGATVVFGSDERTAAALDFAKKLGHQTREIV